MADAVGRTTALAAILLALAVAGGAVAQPRPASPRPAPPAEAETMAGSGAFEQRMDDVARELRDALEPRHGRLEVAVYKLPADATFETIADHYARALAGWQAEPALPRRIRAAEARAWTTGDALFAIALIDRPVAGQRLDYKLLVVASRPRAGGGN